MPKKTRVSKSANLQVLVSWDEHLEEFRIEDVIWPNEKPYGATTEYQLIEVDLARDSSGDRSQTETLFAVLRAHDLHGSEEMRTAMKSVLEVFLNGLVTRGLIQKV